MPQARLDTVWGTLGQGKVPWQGWHWMSFVSLPPKPFWVSMNPLLPPATKVQGWAQGDSVTP